MLVDGIRPLWLSGISETQNSPTGRITEWIGDGEYYFDADVGPTSASFIAMPGSSLVGLFAAEMSRFTSAAIETTLGISRPVMTKSTAWLFIQAYYAAFYAAHSLLRSAGISASNLKRSQCAQVDLIAGALGYSVSPLNSAQFRCEYRPASGRLICTKALGGGVHEQFWRIFDSFLTNSSSVILQNTTLPSGDAQAISIAITDLRTTLRRNDHHGGNWLSSVRNEVTYMQLHKAWFPYGRTKADCDRLFSLLNVWEDSPDSITLQPIGVDDAELFITTCAFLVSLSTAVAKDMARRCSSGTSFLKAGPIRLLNQFSV